MILAIIQARFSSTRLPGKVLKPILDKPMLGLQIERVKRCKKIDLLIVATSMERQDDSIKQLCDRMRIPCFRGDLDNVLDRFYQAALLYRPEHIVRLTGDCPLADSDIIDQTIDFYLQGSYDYAYNAVDPTFPDGLDAEIFSFKALEQAWNEAGLPSQLEHVTPFIYQDVKRFRVGSFMGREDLSHFRWTVDEQADFEFVKQVYEALYPLKADFTMQDILDLLHQRPELTQLNSRFRRNEGFKKSLQQDQLVTGLSNDGCPRCISYQNRAKEKIPGMTQLLSKRPDQFSLGVWPGYFKRAKGVEVWDLDGNRYIDMSIGGIGANVLGYADPVVDAAVTKAVASGNSSSLNCPEEVELAELLCELHPWASKVRYARTGGESMAIAVRIARTHTGRDKIAFCGYHGWHDWYLAANLTGENALGDHLLPGLSPAGVPKKLAGTSFPFHYNRLDELEEIVVKHGKELAAIVMEPIRGTWPTGNFLEGVRAVADETGAVLVYDEISAAFRMNSGGSHMVLGTTPDMAVFSKALGNGYPIAAIIGKEDVMEAAQKTFISSTYWTERIGPAAALATIGKHREVDAGRHLMHIGSLVQAGWKRLAEKYGFKIDVGGIFPLSHFVFRDDNGLELKAFFVQEMLKKGFLASTSFYSMYAHGDVHVEKYLQSADLVFERMAGVRAQGCLNSLLRGKPAVAGFHRLT